MPNSYLNLAQTGKNHWWLYWLRMLLILIIWIYGGGLFALGKIIALNWQSQYILPLICFFL